MTNFLFASQLQCAKNELVIRFQPDEAIFLKVSIKKPGDYTLLQTKFNLTYKSRHDGIYMSDAYERLISDVFLGTQINFIRTDEVAEASRIFIPLLNLIEKEQIKPIPYKFGSQDSSEADGLISNIG